MTDTVHLTEQFHVPVEYHDVCERLTTLVRRHTRRLLADEFWSDEHLADFGDYTATDWTYVRDDEYDAFAETDLYLYSRVKRSIYKRVVHVLDAHFAEYRAFQFVTDTVAERPIRRIGWRRLRTRLFDDEDSPYIKWGGLEAVVEKLNRYYEHHGRFPSAYTQLVDCPEPNGTVPYSPDRGDIHEVDLQGDEVVVTLKAPDSLDSETVQSHHGWSDHTFRFLVHGRFWELVDAGDVGKPTLHASDHGFSVDIPVEIPAQSVDTVGGRVLAVDLGVKKQATAVVVDRDGDRDESTQVTPPTFVDHPSKAKLLRVNSDAEGINDRLAALRRDGKAHTERFAHLLAEYRRTRRKERRLRQQIQHDVANELVWLAVQHGCETIVFESLGQIDNHDTTGAVAWSISSWARGDLLDLVEYRAALLGIEFETVNPWGTSRYCPRCGKRGQTVNAPNDHTECRHGGHFYCPACGFEGDRDYVGALNVGRKHLSDTQMEVANPVDYTSAGKHASFPSHATEECARSAGVQSTADDGQETASGRQTRLSQFRAPSLSAKRRGTGTGGLRQNHGSETGERPPSGSVTRYVLASTTECG